VRRFFICLLCVISISCVMSTGRSTAVAQGKQPVRTPIATIVGFPPRPVHFTLAVYRFQSGGWLKSTTISECKRARFSIRLRSDVYSWGNAHSNLILRRAFRDSTGVVQYRNTVFRAPTIRTITANRSTIFSINVIVPRLLKGLYLAVFNVMNGGGETSPSMLIRVLSSPCPGK
jgi:hypothetical protein